MPHPIDYRSRLQYPASDVYAVMTDPEFLRARLDRLGGPGATLLEHRADADGAHYRVRHGLDTKDLPPVVRSLLAGDIVIERSETWKPRDDGDYAGDVDVLIKGTPASAAGGMRLRDLDAGGSELQVSARTQVDVPLFGGKIEAVVAEQVQRLLAAESAFTAEWLARR